MEAISIILLTLFATLFLYLLILAIIQRFANELEEDYIYDDNDDENEDDIILVETEKQTRLKRETL